MASLAGMLKQRRFRVTGSDAAAYPPMSVFLGEMGMRREIKRFRQAVEQRAIAPALHHNVIDVAAERATLVRRIAYLKKTKKLFDVWHVFHMPLVYIMFVIVLMHVAVTMYMGYVPFMD